ncbi:hypothetical protein M433DRAFT_4157 [Acidomyces richmondensis BFW]|nr:MAG: hypothetical protein FE78DRAFT_67267 [Acidomyces sp. 'richmondensis']KYG45931.1 hypothetical protein M433DRAFT_4157 [Acidomyces richmondensis BFW]
MAHAGGGGGGGCGSSSDGLLDLEKDLTCSICTDILYQPLTLLDCLHTFCGSCLKEWFKWQAASTTTGRRSAPAAPYTCPSCREKVRGTKADWRLTTLLEGYLKAHPDRGKNEEEMEELQKHYKAGEDILPKVDVRRSESDSEDERLVAEVRAMSMGDGDPEIARRRAERSASYGRQGRSQDELSRVPLSEARLREHNANEPHVEHQPSLRSLLSASPLDSHDVQQEILLSIYADGLLDGIDLDNLTTEQEDELTERIADAYRRRQRRRERSGNRERRHQDGRSPQSAIAEREGNRQGVTGGVREPPSAMVRPEGQSRHHTRTGSASVQPPARARPPISRPHVFEQRNRDVETSHTRSTSATSQRSNRSAQHVAISSAPAGVQGARSASDLPDNPQTGDADHQRQRRPSHSNARGITEPEVRSHHAHRGRAASYESRNDAVPPNAVRPLEALRRQGGSNNHSSPSLAISIANPDEHSVRPSISTAAFAPEPLTSATPVPEALTDTTSNSAVPSITCSRCNRANIHYELHYHCSSCCNGEYNLCLSCYRTGRGCDHWYGFGVMAYERWHRLAPPEGWPAEYERPHVLSARRYPRPEGNALAPSMSWADDSGPHEGAFCDSCLAFANECYWYCAYCLDGAWGFCNTCVQQGRHCLHPLQAVAHINTLPRPANHPTDPAKIAFAPLPHLRPNSYVLLPVLTDCDLCSRSIPPNRTRFHCYRCNNGDYDVCTECYYHLVATGKIVQADGPGGWRRCLQGHRMAIVGYQDMPHVGQQRITDREMVGGWRHKERNLLPGDHPPPPPSDESLGMRCFAQWSYFPPEDVNDELGFPKNAEITEVEAKNEDWSVGVYAGRVGLFPSNHVRRIL